MGLQPTSIVQEARDALAGLEPGGEDPPSHAAVTAFLSRLYDLCLAYGSNPDEADALQSFVAETAADVNKLSMAFMYYPADLQTVSRGVWEADEWRQLCRRRSALQFFTDLYRDSKAWSVVEAVEDAAKGLDSFVHARGMIEGHLGDAEIDPAIPRSHWWWWLPRDIRDAGSVP